MGDRPLALRRSGPHASPACCAGCPSPADGNPRQRARSDPQPANDRRAGGRGGDRAELPRRNGRGSAGGAGHAGTLPRSAGDRARVRRRGGRRTRVVDAARDVRGARRSVPDARGSALVCASGAPRIDAAPGAGPRRECHPGSIRNTPRSAPGGRDLRLGPPAARGAAAGATLLGGQGSSDHPRRGTGACLRSRSAAGSGRWGLHPASGSAACRRATNAPGSGPSGRGRFPAARRRRRRRSRGRAHHRCDICRCGPGSRRRGAAVLQRLRGLLRGRLRVRRAPVDGAGRARPAAAPLDQRRGERAVRLPRQ